MPGYRLAALASLGVMMVMAACAGQVDPPAAFVQPTLISPEPKTATSTPQKPTPRPVKLAPTEVLPVTVVPATPTTIPELPPVTPAQVKNTDGLTEDQRLLLAEYPPQGAAPELRNEQWLNSEPLRLAGLRGKVVLLDMWTFG